MQTDANKLAMETTTRASQVDCTSFTSLSPKENIVDSSCKEKKILPGRRQQRHSTEIGAEYHRWWVVRNALGFETNEHIAGLLLDGFHGLLQQLVVMCGGEMYQPCLYGASKSQPENGDILDDLVPAPSRSPSSSSSATSPPGVIEDIEEFTEYKNAITYYCDSLWRLCGQQDRRFHKLDSASRPVQEFLMRLMGYLRAAKGKSFSLNYKKKRMKTSNLPVRRCGDGNLLEASAGAFHSHQPSTVSENQVASLVPTSSLTLLAVHSNPDLMQSTPSLVDDQQKWENKPAPQLVGSIDLIFTTQDIGSLLDNNNKDASASNCVDEGSQIHSSGKEAGPSANDITQEEATCPSPLETLSGSQSCQKRKTNTNKEMVTSASCERGESVHAFPSEVLAQQVSAQCTSVSFQTSQSHIQQLQSPATPSFQTSQQVPQSQASSQKQVDKEGFRALRSPVDQHLGAGYVDSTSFHHQDSPNIHHHWQQQQQCNDTLIGQQGTRKTNQSQPLLWKEAGSDNRWSNTEDDHVCDGRGIDGKENIQALQQPDCCHSGDGNHPSSNLHSSGDADVESLSEEKLQSLLKLKPLPILPYGDAFSDDAFGNSLSILQPKLKNKAKLECRSGTHRKHGTAKAVLADRKVHSSQNSITVTAPSRHVETSVYSTTKTQILGSNPNISRPRISDISPTSTSGNLCSDMKWAFSSSRRPQGVGDLKCQKVVGKEALQPIQPSPFPNPDKLPPLSTPLGTPVILCPANSFPANDNSLASLSTLVQNIVYNSHGTILKPLSLTSGNPLPPVSSYSTQQLNTQSSTSVSDGVSQKRPIAAALPVLSGQLNSGKPALVPFYISHTAMNTLSNLSKCVGLTGVSTMNMAPLSSQTAIQPHVNHQPTPSYAGFSSSARLHQEWSSGMSKPMPNSIVTSCVNQLKITDVRSCSDTDFSNLRELKSEKEENTQQPPAIDMGWRGSGDKINYSPHSSHSSSEVNREAYSSYPQVEQLAGQNFCVSLKSKVNTSYYLSSQTDIYKPPVDGISLIKESEIRSQTTLPHSEMSDQHLNNSSPCHEQTAIAKPPKKILTSLLASKPMPTNSTRMFSYSQSDTELESCLVIPSTAETSVKTCMNFSEMGSTTGQEETLQPGRMSNSQPSKEKLPPPASLLSQKSARSSRRLLCSRCDLLFFSGTDLLVHRYEQHSYVCGECDGRFLSAARLKQHKETDHPSIMLCTHCRFHTFSKEALTEHAWSQHRVNLDTKKEKSGGELNQSRGEVKEIVDGALGQGRDKNGTNTDIVGDSDTNAEVKPTHSCHNITDLPIVSYPSDKNFNTGKTNLSMTGNRQSHGSGHTDDDDDDDDYECGMFTDSPEKISHEYEDGPLGRSVSSQEESTSYENTGSEKAEQDCSKPVFPSFKREMRKEGFQSNPQPVPAVFSQADQPCQTDTMDFLNLSDQQNSENDEPRLIIDTENTGNCREEGLEEEKNCCSENQESSQPLCLVLHNRSSEQTSSSYSCADTTQETKRYHGQYSVTPQPLCKMDDGVGCGKEEKFSSSTRRAVVLKDFTLKTDSTSDKVRYEADHNVGEGKALDLSLNKAEDREKLVMKISIKHSLSNGNPYDSRPHRKRRKKKRKDSGQLDPLVDEPVVEIDNPEDDQGYNMSNPSVDTSEKLFHPLTSNSRHLKLAKAEIMTIDQNIYGAKEMRGRFSRLGHNSMGSCQQQDLITLNMRQGHQITEKPLEEATLNYKTEISTIQQTDTIFAETKVLALRDRHVMSSLPPKKRRFRKSPHYSKEDKESLSLFEGRKSSPRPTENDIPSKTGNALNKSIHSKIALGTTCSENPIETRNKSKLLNKTQAAQSRKTRSGLFCEQDTCRTSGPSDFVLKTRERQITKPNFSEPSSQLLYRGEVPNSLLGRYICPFSNCKTTFSRKWNLDAHLSKVHAKNSLISCSAGGCDLKFVSRKELRQHVTVDHKGKVRKHKCNWPECNKGFFARTHLRIHVLTHTGEKPVACQVCDYRCRQRTALIWHMRKHGVFHKAAKGRNDGSDTVQV